MHNSNRFVSLLGLSALVCACASAQIVPIQGSDPISGSRLVINNNFSYLDGKQTKGVGAPTSACSSATAGTVYVNVAAAEPLSSLYVCANTAPNTYAWELQELQNGVVTTGAYQNPSWLVSLDWSKLINLPAFPNSQVEVGGAQLPQRQNLNFVASTGMSVVASDNGTDTTTLTLSSSGGGGGGSGTVNNGSSGQVAVYQSSGNAVNGVTPSGDASLNVNTGAITVSKTQGSAFAASATTDTTNPANIPYTSPAAGAVASNVKNIATTFLTPDNFGCHMVADSVTDNSCLGAAINAAANGGNNIRIPAPNNTTSGPTHYYLIKSPLTINLHSHTTTDLVQGITIECDGDGTTLVYGGTDPTQGLIKFVGSIGTGLDNVTIKNCTLGSAVNAQYIVQFYGVNGPRLDHTNLRTANGVTVQYEAQYLGSQQGSIISGSMTNGQTDVYLGTLFAPSLGTTQTTLSTSIGATDSTVHIASCALLTGASPTNVFVIDAEHIRASNCSSGTVAVAATCGQSEASLCRGMEGTQATSHVSGATVTTGSTITSNQIHITGGVQMYCAQSCVTADGIDNTLIDGNYLTDNSGSAVFLVNATGNGSVKMWGNQVQAPAGTAFAVLGGAADITGNQVSASTLLNCLATCTFHDNSKVSGAIIFGSAARGSSYHGNTVINTIQSQITLAEPDLLAYNNSLPSDVNFSTLAHIMRLDSPVIIGANYAPPNGDIAAFGVNAFAPSAAYGINVQGYQGSSQYSYLRFNGGISLGTQFGSDTFSIATDKTFAGILASFSASSGITFNRGVQGTTFNGTASTPYSANGVAGVAGNATIGSCHFTFNGILTSGVSSSPVTCGYYQTVYSGATAMAQRPNLQFTGSGVTVSDNGVDTTIVSIAAGGSSAFSGITTGANTTATMTVGTGASITTSGSGVVNANQVNNASIPTSASCTGTNSSGQFVPVSCGGGGGGTANIPTASISGATATLFSQCTTVPCAASKGSNQIDVISATNTVTAPSSGSGTIFVYWTSSGCSIASNGATVTATGSGPCAVTSTSGSGFPNSATAIIASIPYTANTWGSPANFQPTAANPPVITTGTGLTSVFSPGSQQISVDTSAVPIGGGTSNMVARWTNAFTLGTGSIFDDGTNVGMGGAAANPGIQEVLSIIHNVTGSTGYALFGIHNNNATGGGSEVDFYDDGSANHGAVGISNTSGQMYLNNGLPNASALAFGTNSGGYDFYKANAFLTTKFFSITGNVAGFNIVAQSLASYGSCSGANVGTYGEINDGAASLSWGATATAGGSSVYGIHCNGAAWKVFSE